MANNLYNYALSKTDTTSLSELAAQGFSVTNISTDGLLCMVDRRNGSPTLTDPPDLPPYVVESISDPQNMTHAEAKTIINYQASTVGGSDGWYHDNKA